MPRRVRNTLPVAYLVCEPDRQGLLDGRVPSHRYRDALERWRAVTKRIRARPLSGQGYPISMHVECSARMREAYPVGTVFVVEAQEKSRAGGSVFLYSSWQWRYDVMDREEANRKIATRNL